jgi:hypothetical protein
MAKLERVLASVNWDIKYPMTKMEILVREVSDHNPIKLSFGVKRQNTKPIFRFEKLWFEMEEFPELVRKAWAV